MVAPTNPPAHDRETCDPTFLFLTLLAARRSGDRDLESVARDQLARQGIRVRIAKREGERRFAHAS